MGKVVDSIEQGGKQENLLKRRLANPRELGKLRRCSRRRPRAYAQDLECYEELKEVLDNGSAQSEARLSEFAAIGKVRSKVILTTFHASKGRQFDVVIIPGCAEGILPGWAIFLPRNRE